MSKAPFGILSPAKSMNFDGPPPKIATSRPRFAAQRKTIAALMRGKSPKQLQTMQRISPALAEDNARRWSVLGHRSAPKGAAAMCFSGDVYQGLDAASLTKPQQQWLQDHVRLLSGLYGLLRPMDVLQAYRLEMGTRLKIDRAANLYQFWGDAITTALKRDMGDACCLVNLASDEYANAVQFEALNVPVVRVKFLQEVDGTAKFMSFYAKRSRGEFARWMAVTKPKTAAGLRHFDAEGYRLIDDADDTLTFARPKPLPMSAKKRV